METRGGDNWLLHYLLTNDNIKVINNMNKKSIYEQRKRDRKRLLTIKEEIEKVGSHIIKIRNITSKIKNNDKSTN